MSKLVVIARRIDSEQTFTITGRNAWALAELVRTGPRGCTPIDNPGPRWSAYVFNLKREHGLDVETVYERHRGPFAGVHARYVLRTAVEIVYRSEPEPMAA